MAGNSPTQLPAYIQLRYEENGVFEKFASAAEYAAAQTKKRFNQAFKETEEVVTAAVGRMSSQFSKLDLGVGDLRQQQVQIKQYRDTLALVGQAAKNLAQETGDTSVRTKEYLQALTAQRAEAERALQVAEAQIATYSRLQTALDKVSGARGPDMRDAVQRLRDGDAAIDRAALSGVKLENVLGRVASKGREVQAALQQAARAAEESARAEAAALAAQGPRPANALPANTRFGSDAIVAGQAALDRAAASGATLEQVLGRVATKGQAVTAAINEMAAADARAAKEQADLALAIDRLNAELDPTVAATQRYNAQVRLLDDALKTGAIDAQRHAQMMQLVNNASHEGTTAFRAVTNSAGAMRVALLQSGQQMQDIAISLYSGQRASVVFAQQLPQLAFALTGLEGSTNKTYDRIGKFATFLSGPWGLAVGLGVGVLAGLVTEFVTAGDEADKTKQKTMSLTEGLARFKDATDEARKAIDAYNDSQKGARDNADFMIKVNLDSAEAKLRDAQATREQLKAELERQKAQQSNPAFASSLSAAGLSAAGALSGIDARLSANAADMARLDEAARNLRIQDARREAEASIDPLKAINNQYDDMRDRAIAAAAANDALSKSLKGTLTGIEQQRKTALDAQRDLNRSGNGARDARIGDMVALTKQLFPGAIITSTTGGKHVKGSDHYTGHAIDFVPAGGMGQYTKAEVEQILEDAGVDIRRNAKGVKQIFGPGDKGHSDHFHFAFDGSPDPEKVAAAAERAQQKILAAKQRLAEFGERSAESIARINERFDEQPRLIDSAAAATRQLDSIITDLSQRKPPGFEQMIQNAEAAKATVQDALVRPFRDMTRDSERRLQIQTLLAKGREDEADALTEVWRMEDTVGKLSSDQVDYVRDVVMAEKERTRELQRQRELFDAQLDVLDTVRNELTSLLSGRGFNFKNIVQSIRDLQGKRLFDQIFGDVFRDLENELRGQSPLGRESQRFADEMSVATNALGDFTSALGGARTGIAANDNGIGSDSLTAGSAEFNAAFQSILSGRTTGWTGLPNLPGAMSVKGANEIVVTGVRQTPIIELANKISGAIVSPFQEVLSSVFGTSFAQMLSGVLQGFIGGKMVGGTTGGIIGGLKGFVDQTGIFGGAGGGVSKALGGALNGAATGSLVAGLGKSLGINMSNTGAQIGGAIGSFIPIPGGQIIGSVFGGLLGGLFKKKPHGTAVLTSAYDDAAIYGNKGSARDAAGTLAGSVQEGLINIADQLGASLGGFNVSIGTYKDKYRVGINGGSGKLGGHSGSAAQNEQRYGLYDFGSDSEAAIKFAISDAIKDGALLGLKKSTQAILQQGKDLDVQIQKALDWEGAFKELQRYKDPIGAALDDLDKSFQHLIDIGKEAGASQEEMAQLEELYGIKRNEIIKQQAQQLVGSLQDLYDSLTIGDSGLSLRSREANALAKYQPLAARVAAGDTTAYDDYAKAAQDLLGIERELYGSQQQYFDRLGEITDLTRTRIDAETNVVSIAENRNSPFDSAGQVNTSINNQTDVLSSQLTAVNSNLGAILEAIRAGQAVSFGAIAATLPAMNY